MGESWRDSLGRERGGSNAVIAQVRFSGWSCVVERERVIRRCAFVACCVQFAVSAAVVPTDSTMTMSTATSRITR